jgi:hypothetical protein
VSEILLQTHFVYFLQYLLFRFVYLRCCLCAYHDPVQLVFFSYDSDCGSSLLQIVWEEGSFELWLSSPRLLSFCAQVPGLLDGLIARVSHPLKWQLLAALSGRATALSAIGNL